MGSFSWNHKDDFFHDEQCEILLPVGNFHRQNTEPANSFSAYHRTEKEVIEAWPFHEQREDIETTETRDNSAPTSEATPTPPPEPSAESWSSWDQNVASNSVTGYLVPFLVSSPCVPEVPTPAFLGSMSMGYDQRQFMVPAPPKACSQTPPPDWGSTTTVMMRNLANKYTQRLLLTEINESGFIGTFDFLYLPIDTDTNANKGYAFINFSESGFAWMFKQAFEGRRMQMFNSDKVVSVSAAALQGYDNNYAHYVNARCNRGDPACRPLFLRAPSSTITTKPVARSGRRNGRGHGQSNLDRLAETQQLQQQLELAVQALMTKQQQEQQQQQQDDRQLQSATRFCPYCGNKAKVDFKFCPGCGSSLSSVEAT